MYALASLLCTYSTYCVHLLCIRTILYFNYFDTFEGFEQVLATSSKYQASSLLPLLSLRWYPSMVWLLVFKFRLL